LKKAKSEYEKASNEQVPEKNVKTEDKEVNILV